MTRTTILIVNLNPPPHTLSPSPYSRKVWRECVDSDDERSKQVPLAMLERILVSHGALDLVTEEELRTLLLKMRLPSESGGK